MRYYYPAAFLIAALIGFAVTSIAIGVTIERGSAYRAYIMYRCTSISCIVKREVK